MRSRTLPLVASLSALLLSVATVSPVAAAEPADVVLLQDAMSRTVVKGLGAAATGTTYEVSSTASFSVANGRAKIGAVAAGATATARPVGITAADSTQSTVFTLPQLPKSGAGVYLSLQSRVTTGGFYQTQLRIDPKGVVLLETQRVNAGVQTTLGHTTVPELRVKAGMPFVLETRLSGSTAVAVDARVSAVGAKPTTWKLSVTDRSAKRLTASGRMGVRVYVSRSTPTLTTLFDDLRVTTKKATTPTPPTNPTNPTNPTPPKPPTNPTPPTPPTPPTTPAGNAPAWNVTGARTGAGSAAVGTTTYPVPAGALFVSPSGKSAGTGTSAAPFASVQAAVDRAASGATLVLRAGSYAESVVVPSGKKITIQSYPGEAVWFDGATTLKNWQSSGGRWFSADWKYDFDSTPSFTRGESDGTAAGWKWLNPAYPMAAHPEQVWIDGVAQAEVASLAALKAGTFFTDVAADRLYLGSDPTGRTVRTSTLTKALSLRGEGAVVRGIGVRNYATSVWMMGAVTVEAPRATLENVVIYDTATTGLFVGAANATIRDVTLARNGLMGLGANYADALVVDDLLSLENNAEHFNTAPVSGGVKITKSRGVTVTDSAMLRNDGPGLWLDQSVYDVRIAGSDFVENRGAGAFLELSNKIDFVNNLVLRNVGNGVKINNTGAVNLWNNTIIGGDRAVNIVQDSRSSTDAAVPGHNSRRPFPDATMPWLIRDISIGNNVIGESSGNCTVCIEDYTHRYTPAELRISSDGNVIQRNSASAPTWFVVWSRGTANVDPYVFTTWQSYRSTTGQDANSTAVEGRPVTDSSGRLLAGVTAATRGLPGIVASILGSSTPTIGARFP
ncbi:right-handed parallel beta-helix repeat-containing protein [Microbacterium foliorum]|uniref:right-handed parallel beta-helix repeat-containing protein n=1 Tax=Microbacterium foliorum TaxID=104336 RepID=UPI0028D78B9B|nr:right-handed parallel beta-helix repeat-containing protein [Microbacterium foliorum]